MAELLIILHRDPATGKQNIVVKLDSDPDALPVEHEQMHRSIVEKLVGKGMKAEDLGEIVIEREGVATPGRPSPTRRRANGRKPARGSSADAGRVPGDTVAGLSGFLTANCQLTPANYSQCCSSSPTPTRSGSR